MHTKETLTILRRRGVKGISSSELANKFGFKVVGSASKLINQLRSQGYGIDYDTEQKIYVLISDKPDPSDEPVPDGTDEIPEDVPEEADSIHSNNDATFFKISSKKDKILELLVRSGTKGASAAELGKYSGVSKKNISCHIHTLRHVDGKKINSHDGLYFLKGGKKHPLYDTGIETLPISSDPVELEAILGDKRLLRGISRIPQGTQLATYMDLIQKIIYYTKCALAMHDTADFIETLTIGDGR